MSPSYGTGVCEKKDATVQEALASPPPCPLISMLDCSDLGVCRAAKKKAFLANSRLAVCPTLRSGGTGGLRIVTRFISKASFFSQTPESISSCLNLFAHAAHARAYCSSLIVPGLGTYLEAHIRACLESRHLPMAPHLMPAELDKVLLWSHTMTGPEVLRRLTKVRERSGLTAPRLRTVQKVMAGTTFRRGGRETRGRKAILWAALGCSSPEAIRSRPLWAA